MFVAVLGVAYALWKPRWAFVLVVLLFPIKQLIQGYVPAMRGYGQFGPNLAVAAVAALALGIRVIRGERPLQGYKNAGTVFTLLLYGMAALGLLYTPSIDGALSLFKEGLPYQILLLGVLPMLVADVRDLRRLLIGLLIAGAVISVLVMLNPAAATAGGRLQLNTGVQTSVTGRGRSNPLALAELGGIVTVVAGLLTFQKASWALNALRVACLIMGLGLAIMSGSRGQVLAAVAVVAAFYPISRRIGNFKQLLVTGVSFALVAGAVYLTFKVFLTDETGGGRWSGSSLNSSVDDRIVRIQTLFQAWSASPMAWVIGIGTNGFSSVWPGEGLGGSTYVHNVVAEAIFELGIIGFAFFSGVAVSTMISAKRLLRTYRDDPDLRSASAALVAMGAYSFLLAIKQGCIITIPAPFHWWLVICYVWKRESLLAHQRQHLLGDSDAADAYDDELPMDEPDLAARPGMPAAAY